MSDFLFSVYCENTDVILQISSEYSV